MVVRCDNSRFGCHIYDFTVCLLAFIDALHQSENNESDFFTPFYPTENKQKSNYIYLNKKKKKKFIA